jgi:uncharacterized membrane protein YfhO
MTSAIVAMAAKNRETERGLASPLSLLSCLVDDTFETVAIFIETAVKFSVTSSAAQLIWTTRLSA